MCKYSWRSNGTGSGLKLQDFEVLDATILDVDRKMLHLLAPWQNLMYNKVRQIGLPNPHKTINTLRGRNVTVDSSLSSLKVLKKVIG